MAESFKKNRKKTVGKIKKRERLYWLLEITAEIRRFGVAISEGLKLILNFYLDRSARG